MGAIKPWHLLVLLFCFVVVSLIVAGGVTALVRSRRRSGNGD